MAVEGENKVFTPRKLTKEEILELADYGLTLIRAMKRMANEKANSEPEFFRVAFPQVQELYERVTKRTVHTAFFNQDIEIFNPPDLIII